MQSAHVPVEVFQNLLTPPKIILLFAVQNRMFIGKVSVFMELLLPHVGRLNIFAAKFSEQRLKLPDFRMF
jgi:hypothetical protein